MDPDNQRPDFVPEYFGTLYHAGSVFTIAWFALLLVVGAQRGGVRRTLRDPWMGLALVTFLLALGNIALLWTWQAKLPVLNQFNHPLKFLPFFHLFSCAVGAGFIHRLTRRSSFPHGWQAATFMLVASVLLCHAFWMRSALFVYADQPYSPLPSELADLRRNDGESARILPVTFFRSESSNYVVGLHHHFPTLYGISSVGGYDPLIEQDSRYASVLKALTTDPRTAIRKYGVTHLVLHREVTDAMAKRDWASDDWRKLPPSFYALAAECEKLKPVMQTESVRIYPVSGTTSIAYRTNEPSKAFPVELKPAGVAVDVTSLESDQEVTLNYLWRPGIRVYADGGLVTSSADADQRIVVPVRAGTKLLELRYESPWSTGLLLGGLMVGGGLLGCLGVHFFTKGRSF
jgi:hypothetical protein